MVPLSYYLVLGGILFACGVAGFLIKRNIITIFLSIELMLNGVNLRLWPLPHNGRRSRTGFRFLCDGSCCGRSSRRARHYHRRLPHA